MSLKDYLHKGGSTQLRDNNVYTLYFGRFFA